MTEQERSDQGKFLLKGETVRTVRSIRLTDQTWLALGEKADSEDMTRADYLEGLFSGQVEWEEEDSDIQSDSDSDLDEAVELLREALTYKANAGGKIKAVVRQVIQLLGYDPEES